MSSNHVRMIRPHGGIQKHHAAEFDAFMVSISLSSYKQTKNT